MSPTTELAVYVIASVMLFTWTLLPMLRPRLRGAGERDLLMQERTRSLIAALNRLDTTQEKSEDSSNIRHRLMVELARTYEQQGINPTAGEEEQVDGVCTCKTPVKGSFKFCPSCGRNLAAA